MVARAGPAICGYWQTSNANRAAPAAPPDRSDPAASRSARRHDQAFRGYHHPAAVLSADGVDATEPRHHIALIDLDEAHTSFDERGPAMDVAHHPSVDGARLGRLVHCRWWRQHRAGHILGRSLAAGKTLECVDGFGQLGRRLGLRALDAVDALADPSELGRRVAVGGI